MQQFLCLICNKIMDAHNKIMYIDHACTRNNHHLSWRIKDNKIMKLRVRFTEEETGKHLTVKIHYDDQYTEVYTLSKDRGIKVQSIIPIDFNNIEKIKLKLRTMLVFG